MARSNIVLVDEEETFAWIHNKVPSIIGVDCPIQTVSNGFDAVDIINKYLGASTEVEEFIFIDLTMEVSDALEFLWIFSSIEFNRTAVPAIVVQSQTLDAKGRKRVKDMGIEYIASCPLTVEEFKRILL